LKPIATCFPPELIRRFTQIKLRAIHCLTRQASRKKKPGISANAQYSRSMVAGADLQTSVAG
jgi:hypothetical protein